MNEPSVLDYLKSIFKSGDAFRNFVKAVFERRDTTQLIEADFPASQLVTMVERVPVFDARTFPWFTLFVLLLALGGQRMFEPPQQLYTVGIVLYISALAMALLAFRRGEWNLTPLPVDETRTDSFSIRIVPFVLSLF